MSLEIKYSGCAIQQVHLMTILRSIKYYTTCSAHLYNLTLHAIH